MKYMDEKKLVVKKASRFISMSAGKRLESIKRHKLWQSKLDKNGFFDKVFGLK
jgi:hypothetical protein